MRKFILLPDFKGINDYFTNFLQKEPQGEILESNVMIGHNWCQDAGIYEFTFGATGQKVKGRYSFIYVYEDGEWKISHHSYLCILQSHIILKIIAHIIMFCSKNSLFCTKRLVFNLFI